MKRWKPRINRCQAGMNVAAKTSHRPRKVMGSRHHRLRQRPRGLLLEHLLTGAGSVMAPTGKSISSAIFSPTEAGWQWCPKGYPDQMVVRLPELRCRGHHIGSGYSPGHQQA